MKRSEINEIIRETEAFVRSSGFWLPPFAHWSPAEFEARRKDASTIVERGMGWNVSDFGWGEFQNKGIVVLTTRNGHLADLPTGGGMLYTEKVIVMRKDQFCPSHRHNMKTEDIINRSGGSLAVQLHMSDAAGNIDPESEVIVPADGILRRLPAGGIVKLRPGESITLVPGVWHAFWAEGADVLAGEVSTVNDDSADNIFDDPVNLSPSIEEDESSYRMLVRDYGMMAMA